MAQQYLEDRYWTSSPGEEAIQPTTESRLVATLRAWPHNQTAAAELVLGHRDMARGIAREYTNGGGEREFEELFGEGQLALCEAVPSFITDNPGCRFSTYAHTRVKRAVISFLRQDGTIRGSDWEARVAKKARASQERLAQRLGRFPTQEELTYSRGTQEASALYDLPTVEHLDPQDLEQEATRPHRPGVRGRGRVWAWASVDPEAGMEPDRFELLPAHTRAMIRALLATEGATVGWLASQIGENRDEMMAELAEAHRLLANRTPPAEKVSTPPVPGRASPQRRPQRHANRYVQRRRA